MNPPRRLMTRIASYLWVSGISALVLPQGSEIEVSRARCTFGSGNRRIRPIRVKGTPKPHSEHRSENQAGVEPKAHMFDVVEVVIQLAAHAGRIGVGGCCTWANPVKPGRTVSRWRYLGQGALELVEEFRAFGPGPDQAHLALQDVHELGKLVEVAVQRKTGRPA